MPIPVRHLRQALLGTACHVVCGALLPPNARPTPQSCPAISGVNELHAGLRRSLVQLAGFGRPDDVDLGQQGRCSSLLTCMA